jgi:hypothetical protein
MAFISAHHSSKDKGILRKALESQVESMFKDRSEGDKILVGHNRRIAELERNTQRQKADIAKEKTLTEKLLNSERENLDLLKKREKRMTKATPPQPTEVVKGEILNSQQRIVRLEEQKDKLAKQEVRLDEDKRREEAETIEDTRRKLKEV